MEKKERTYCRPVPAGDKASRREGETGVRHRNRRMEKRVSGNAHGLRSMPEQSSWAHLPTLPSPFPDMALSAVAQRASMYPIRPVWVAPSYSVLSSER